MSDDVEKKKDVDDELGGESGHEERAADKLYGQTEPTVLTATRPTVDQQKGPNGDGLPTVGQQKGPNGEILPVGAQQRGPNGEILPVAAQQRGPNGEILPVVAQQRGPNGEILPAGAQQKGPNGEILQPGGGPQIFDRLTGRQVQFNQQDIAALSQKLNGAVAPNDIMQALQELSTGTIGPAVLDAYRNAAKAGMQGPFHQDFMRLVGQLPNTRVQDITPQGLNNELHLRVKSDTSNNVQTVELKFPPAGGGRGIESIKQRVTTDNLATDPLTSTMMPPDDRSTAQRAKDAGVQLPQAFSPENLAQRPIPVPDLQNPANNPGGKPMNLSEFAKSLGLEHHRLNDYYQAVFFASNDAQLRQQAIQGLRDEVMSGKNPSALHTLQDITAKKAAIELREAEKRGDKDGQMKALVQLASVEQFSSTAADILRGPKAKPGHEQEPHPLAAEARKQARELANQTFGPADAAYGAFLNRDLDKLPPDQRHEKRLEAIRQLDHASEQRLNIMSRDDFSHVKRTFQSMDALMTMRETNSPREAAKQLDTMFELTNVHKDTTAMGYLNQLERSLKEKGVPDLDTLKKDLEAGGARGDKALKALKESVPDLTGEMNNFRLDRIMRGLNADSSSADMEKASKALEEEHKAGNPGAADLLKWTKTGESSLKIQEAINSRKLDDPQSVKDTAQVINTEMGKLAQMTNDGNLAARSALVGMLTQGLNKDDRDSWAFQQDKPPHVPDLSKLKPEEVALIKEKAALSITESLKKNSDAVPLSRQDSEAVSLSLADAYKNGDQKLQKALEGVFEQSLKGKGREQAVSGLIDAMSSEQPGTEKLAELLVKAAKDGGLTDLQHFNLNLLAKRGNEPALRALSSIAAGAIDEPWARSAANTLKEAGTPDGQRDKVLSIMTEQYKKSGDSGFLLAAMGATAARDASPNSEVQKLVREGFEKASANVDPKSAIYESAKQGFIAMAAHFNKQDVETLSKNLRPDMVKELTGLSEKMPAEQRAQFLEMQHDALVKGTPAERIAAVQAMGAFSKFVTPTQAADLAFFTGKRGQDELKRAGMDKPEDMKAFMDSSAKTLLALMGSADHKVQDEAYAALSRKQDWPGLLGDPVWKQKIIDYAQGRPSDLELNKEAMTLIYDAGIARPLPGVLKDLGVKGSTDELIKLSDKIAANYTRDGVDGRDLAKSVLANAAAINALAPEMREKLTGSKASIDMAQLIGQLSKGSIDAGHPPNNPLFSDVKQWIQKEQRDLDNKSFQLQQEIKSHEQMRSSALKWLGEHTKDQRIGLGERFADTFMGTDFIGNFEQNQGMNVRRVERINADLQKKIGELSKVKADQAFLDLASQSMDHFRLSMSNVKAADQLLMDMVARQGAPTLAKFAPNNFEQIPAAMKRLQENKLGNESKLPEYSGPNGFQDALKGLAKLNASAERGWASDYGALKNTAFQAIDSRESFQKIQAGSAEISSRLPILQEMFSSGMKGSRYEEFVKTAKAHAGEIQKALDAVKPEDIQDARKAVEQMKEALKDVKDAQAAEQLKERIKAYESAIDLFGGKMNGQIRSMLNEILKKDSFDETTFANWATKEGPVVAASIVAAAAVIALTAGAATPVVVAGLIVAPAAALAAGELTKEGLQWTGVRKEGSFLGDSIRGGEIYDPETGKMRKIDLGDVAGQYGKQYLMDLAISLGTLGAGNLLAKGINKIGSATFGKLLAERGAAMADLSKGLTRAEIAAAQAGQKGFVKEFLEQVYVQTSFGTKQAIGEDMLKPLMEGQYDKYVPLLVSMALITAHGVSFKPQGKHIEFDLKPGELNKAPELLAKQMLQFHNDGMTVRPGKGGAFEVISPKGEVTEFRPSAAVAEQLKNFKAPDWVTNAKPIISTPHLGEIGSKIKTEQARTAPDKLAAQVEDARLPQKETPGRRPREIYRPEIPEPTEPVLKGIRENLPEMNGKPVVEFDQRMQKLQERWSEDHSRKQQRLNALEPEFRDAELALEKQRAEHLNDALLGDARDQAVKDAGGFRKWMGLEAQERQRRIDENVSKKLEAMEKNPDHPLGKAKIEFDRLQSEQAKLNAEIKDVVAKRQADLQKEFDYMHEKHGWPKVKLEVGENMQGTAGGYRMGTGQLFIPKETLLAAGGRGDLHTTAFHEMVHAVQDRFIAEYALHKAGGDVNQAKSIYEGMMKRPPDGEFMKEVARDPKIKEWNEKLETRAKDLAAKALDSLDVGTRSSELGRQAQFIEGRLHSLKRDKNGKAIDNLFEHFDSKTHGEAFQKGLFPNGMPPEVQKAFQEWKSARENGTEFNSENARQTVAKALERELADTNKEHKALVEKYASNPLELEAYAAESKSHYGAIVDAAKAASTQPAPAETVQSAKALLDASSAKKGDPLHTDSRGSEALRKMYDAKLQDGSIKPQDLKKLLELKPEDRGAIESMLLKGRINNETFASLMKQEPKLINDLLNNSQKTLSEVLLPALERGLVDPQKMSQLLDAKTPEPERKIALDFIEKAVKDPTKSISPESMNRFLDLGKAERAEVAKALGPQGQAAGAGQLSAAEINAALQTPTRTNISGQPVSDAPALIRGMQRGVISAEQLKQFSTMDEAARSGFSGLLKMDALSGENAAKLMDMVKSGEMKGVTLTELNVAKLKGWLPEQSLDALLKQEPRVRETTIKAMSAELAKGREGNFSISETLDRMGKLNDLQKAWVINEATMKMLAEPHAVDTVLGAVLKGQASKGAAERVSAESLQKLAEMSRKGDISLETLDAYRSAIEKGTLNKASLDAMLQQKPEIRRAAEAFMSMAPEKFAGLLKEGRFQEMAARLPEISSGPHTVFPDMFPEGGKFEFEANQKQASSPQMKDITEFMSRMSKGDYKGALDLMESKTVTPDQKTPTSTEPEIRWVEKKIALADLNNPQALNEMHNFMKSQGTAKGTMTEAHNPNAVEKSIKVADPIIELPDGKQVRLRDANQIYENNSWRRTTAQEKAMIEKIQQSDGGKALLGKTAMIVMEEWAHTTQTPSGGVSQLTQSFAQSPLFAEMKKAFADQGLKGPALDARVNEALREIDIGAALKESGLSTKGLQKLFGDQHLKGEREYFYKFLEAQEKSAATKPAASPATGTPPSGEAKPPSAVKPDTTALRPPDAPAGLRPSLDLGKPGSTATELRPEQKLAERAAKVSPDAAKTAGLAEFISANKLNTEQGQQRLKLAEVLTQAEKLPDAVRADLTKFLDIGPQGPKPGRLALAEHLLQVAKDQGSEKAHTLLEGMRKVCDIEAERAKAPKIPSMEEIFKPEELARIKAIKEAQDALPVAKLTAPEHAAKVEEFYKKFASEVPGGAPAQEKVLHIVIGPPGAGKTSTLVDPLTREYRALVVDSDRIKPSINGYTADFQGKPEVGLGTNAVHHASSQVANDILQKAMQNGDNIVYPILGRVPESLIDITMRAKAQGYKVALHIADVPPEVAARRVFERAKGLPDENGVRQMVPPGYATSVAKYDPQIVFDKILKSMPDLFDAWRYANTNVPKGQPAIERRSTQQIPPPRR